MSRVVSKDRVKFFLTVCTPPNYVMGYNYLEMSDSKMKIPRMEFSSHCKSLRTKLPDSLMEINYKIMCPQNKHLMI